MKYYRKHFPHATVLPKMHILESHVADRIERWGVGLGLMGEQGAESIHASLNQIERSYLNMPNKVDRLLCVVREHHLRVDPEHQSLAPPLKKRNVIATTIQLSTSCQSCLLPTLLLCGND